MTDQDSPRRTSVIADLMAVLNDHWELAALELGYETRQAFRRLTAIIVALVFGVLALIVLQVSIIYGLMATGLSAVVSCLLVGGGYAIISLLVLLLWGRREARAGAPFAGTRREVGRTLKWIQKLFS